VFSSSVHVHRPCADNGCAFVCLPSGFIQNAAPVQMHKKYARRTPLLISLGVELLLLAESPFIIMLDVHIVLSWVCFLSRAI
jgi:hypothetical protein